MQKKFTIVGAGIAGLVTGICLQEAGYEVEIYEAAESFKEIGAGLVLASNAVNLLKRLPLYPELLDKGLLLHSLKIYDKKGNTLFHETHDDINHINEGAENLTIHRAALQQVLLSFFKGKIHLGKKAVYAGMQGNLVKTQFEDGSFIETHSLIVADGIHSRIRKKLTKRKYMRYAGYTCWRAVVDYPGSELLGNSETWAAEGRFGIAPLKNGKVYWFACINARENDEKYKQFTLQDLANRFAGFHSPVPKLISLAKEEDLIHGDIYDLEPLKRFAFEKIVLIGDAAHATTPNLGQGACMAIEDAFALVNNIIHHERPRQAFKFFEQERKKRVTKIINLSRQTGKMAQLENKMAIAMRNRFLRFLPKSFTRARMKKILEG